MQQAAPSRKRAAPGASPLVQQPMTPQPAFQFQSYADNPDFANLDFTNAFPADQSYSDSTFPENTSLATALNTSQLPTYDVNATPPGPSTDLVRRTRNQQLAPQNMQQEQWNGDDGEVVGTGDENEQDLNMKVALAKRAPPGKRKQIPPFVQKLARQVAFLDNNTELIRWSDDGRSFIVLDEDEFARTLIPELFKHNNYASFVRQLNMYGFHKTVNITDGSLRQSEKARKGVKPPSMYSHPYFRRNRPDLLWLIQKPTTAKASGKRKRDGSGKDAFDSDDERQASPAPEGRPQGDLGTTGGNQDLTSMPRTEMSAVRQEIKKLQQQQNIISRMIGQLKEQNDQFYRQATAFQALHDRHENSINAILTFLATFYNRSLEGHAGQNLVNMFSNVNDQNNQQHGSVVEEYNDNAPDSNKQIQRYVKKPPLLLTASDDATTLPLATQGRATTEPSSARATASPANRGTPPVKQGSPAIAPNRSATSATKGRSTASPALKTDAAIPDLLHQVPENDQMLSLINDVNASTATESGRSAPAFDFNAAFDKFNDVANNKNGRLTPQQRDDMLSMMANPNANATDSNALTSQNQAFNFQDLQRNQQTLEQVEGMQKDLNERLSLLHDQMTPLSPSGAIPGFGGDASEADDYMNSGTGDPGAFDLSQPYDPSSAYLNFDDNADSNFVNGLNNGDFDWDETAGMGLHDSGADMFRTGDEGSGAHIAPIGGTIESLSNSETTSPAGTVPVGEEGEAGDMDPGTPNKRQKRSSGA